MIVQSFGQLQTLKPSTAAFPSSPGYAPDVTWMYDDCDEGYAAIYATQPNVRICVDFLARNVAQIGVHAFRRVSDVDRERLADHQVVQWLGHPNPSTTTYRLIESLMGDLGVYFNAYWLKVRYVNEDGKRAIGLVRLPPSEMHVIGGLLPSAFEWTRGGRTAEFPTSEVVHFDGYNPLNPLKGLSPLETLATVLREDTASVTQRESYWKNAARQEVIIERPREAPKWTPAQKQSWREQWQLRFAGPANAGMVPVLEDGMTAKAISHTARDSEYSTGRKLSREEVARAYHIPLPMVGILDHATFSNIKEQHKQLYQDCLAPWTKMIEQELGRQLLVEADDQRDVYLEFNIAEKLKGSFEEQASALQVLVGRPIMTANEGRARLNLPSIKDDASADQLAAQQGGPSDNQANPGSSDGPEEQPAEDRPRRVAATVGATRARQRAKLSRVPDEDRSTVFFGQMDRWNRELASDLTPVLGVDAATRVAIQSNLDFFTELDS